MSLVAFPALSFRDRSLRSRFVCAVRRRNAPHPHLVSVLNEGDLEISAGDRLGIIGADGAGKTALQGAGRHLQSDCGYGRCLRPLPVTLRSSRRLRSGSDRLEAGWRSERGAPRSRGGVRKSPISPATALIWRCAPIPAA
jgi:hypothetical protein